MMHAMLGRRGATVGTQAAAERQIVGGILSCKAPQAAAPRAHCLAQASQCRRDVRAAYTRVSRFGSTLADGNLPAGMLQGL